MTNPDAIPADERIVKLELLVTHLEHELAQMHSVVLAQQKQLEALERVVSRLDERLTRVTSDDEQRDILSERPPHY
jgi:SlyX protein